MFFMSFMSIFWACIFIVNTITVVSIIFVERKHPNTAVSWILAIIFVPILGLIAYSIFGTEFLVRRKLKAKLSKINDHLKTHSLYKKLCKHSLFKGKDPLVNSVMHKIFLLNGHTENTSISHDNKIDLYIDAKFQYFDLLNDINTAKHSIHMLYFIIHSDNIGTTIINALIKQAKSGVKVRLMFDVNASAHLSRRLLKELQNSGGEICHFLPSIFKNIIRINYRMHRKIVVIDGKIGYLGGMNIGDEYMGLNPKISPWRDTHIRIRGSAVHALQIRFLLDWENIALIDLLNQDDVAHYFPESLYASQHDNSGADVITNQASVQIISSGPDQIDMNIRNSMIIMINNAKESILIQTPYFIPDEPFMQALILAARTGVNVSIMIPKIPDKPYIYASTLSYTEELIKYGINIYAYHGFMHAKTLIIDDKICTIGTSNIDYRSFELNFEINAFIYDVGFSQKYAQIFRTDLEHSTLLTHSFYEKRPRIQKILSAISRLLSPLM